MKPLNRLFIITVLLSFISPLALAETKIAVVDWERALLATKFAQQQQKKLSENTEFKSMMEKVQLLQADLQALQKDANDKGMAWSNEERAENENNFNFKRDNYQRIARKIQSQRQNTINVIKQHFTDSAKEVIEKITEDEARALLEYFRTKN